jgi:peptidoglycan/xylan/chitin deacetylase (PgdA/CDA1 family)
MWLTCISILTFFVVPGKTFAAPTIAQWKNNKSGAISLTFDDGYALQYSIGVTALNEFGFRGTFFVITDDVSLNIPRYVSWENWRNAANAGHEIGSHSKTHPHLSYLSTSEIETEILDSQAAIDSQITSQECLSFAYPYGDFNQFAKSITESAYIGARGASPGLNSAPFDFFNAKVWFPESVVGSLESQADLAEQSGAWMIAGFHGFDGTEYGPVTEEEFRQFLSHISSKNLWVDTFGAVTRYIRERGSASLRVVSNSSGKMVLSLTDGLDDILYDEELTIRSEVPSDCTSALVAQGSQSTTVPSVSERSTRIIYFDAIPDRGEITITYNFNISPGTLTSGESQAGSVAQGEWAYYRIDASALDSQVMIELTNLSADVDLYVQAGSQPTLSNYHCRPYLGGTNAETCTLSNSAATTWFIGVHGYRAGSFSVKATVLGGGSGSQVTLEAGYSVDARSDGAKFYHDGNDWVGRSGAGALRTVNLWDISSIDAAWDISAVEVRFYTESKTGSTGALSVVRYGSSHGEDDPRSDSGAAVYSKSGGSPYASLPEPSAGAWSGWVNLGDTAAADLQWCRDNGRTIWSVGLKASAAVEAGTTVSHVDVSEDNEAVDAELRITYSQGAPSNHPPAAVIDSISPNPASAGASVTFTGHGVDADGSVAAYSWTSSIDGGLGSSSVFSTASLSVGTHTISLRVQDNLGAWSNAVTASLIVTGGSGSQVTLEAGYSVDARSDGAKFYHDGNDWVGRSGAGALRTVNLWDISSIDAAWDISAVEVRFYTESKTGSTGALSVVRYGSSHGEDDPRSDSGAAVYSKSGGSPYASLPEPSAGAWSGWVNLGDTAAADLQWCRDNGRTIWSVGLKASAAVEAGTTVSHVDVSEDNEAVDAELRITYMP